MSIKLAYNENLALQTIYVEGVCPRDVLARKFGALVLAKLNDAGLLALSRDSVQLSEKGTALVASFTKLMWHFTHTSEGSHLVAKVGR